MNKKRIAILGSTGTIGMNTLKVCQHLTNEIEVVGLAVHSNIEQLIHQIKEFQPKIVSVWLDENRKKLQGKLSQYNIPVEEIGCGLEGLVRVATHPTIDLVVVATVGAIGLIPTLKAIQHNKTIALANKEVLVMAGELIMQEAKEHKIHILPIDSEHNAIFQCLTSGSAREVKKLLLTGSGGPFRNHRDSFDEITPEQALKHPTWNMGKKITIDSSTLMNKGFEVIECTHLFDIPPDRIEVVIHPQSIIHSMVEFIDGSIIAQMSITDMFLPIQFALTYPERKPTPFPPLDLKAISQLTFEHPDFDRFPCLRFGYNAGEAGGTMPAVLNAANEISVQSFLNKEIVFSQLPVCIAKTMESHQIKYHPVLEDILDADRWARQATSSFISKLT